MHVLASIPLSGKLVTCPWYWEYHSVEFSVPACVENLELSVPTHLVLTFCSNQAFCMTKRKQTWKFCLLFVKLAERLFLKNKNLKNTSRKFPHYVLGSAAVKKLVKSELSHLPAQQNMFLRTKLSRRKTGKIIGAKLGS